MSAPPDPGLSVDPLRHHRAHRKHLIGSAWAEQAAEHFADFLGTIRFVVTSSTVILAWIAFNSLEATRTVAFDRFPFILLNLAFSAFAFYTGALVIIAQKAAAKRDLAREEADATHREELHGHVVQLIEANTALTEEVHALVASSEKFKNGG